MYVDRKWRLAGTLLGYAAVSWYRDNGGDGSEHALAVRECPVLRLRIPYRTHIGSAARAVSFERSLKIQVNISHALLLGAHSFRIRTSHITSIHHTNNTHTQRGTHTDTRRHARTHVYM